MRVVRGTALAPFPDILAINRKLNSHISSHVPIRYSRECVCYQAIRALSPAQRV